MIAMSRRAFKVGTFNLCNLVLPNTVFYDRERYSTDDYAKKKLWIAGQLDQMQADIVGFQEVFHEEALRDVLRQSAFYREFHVVAADPTGEHPTVALASRFPILESQVIRDFPAQAQLDIQGAAIPLTRFSRPVLAVRLRLTDTVDCTVFVVHLKSKRAIFAEGADRQNPIEKAKGEARSLMLRAGEAIALRVLLMEVLQNRNYPVIVIGDMNDGGAAVTSQIISGEVPQRKLEPERKRKLWDILLYHVKDIQARQSYGDFYYTHIHNGHYQSLDHIMVSQEFVTQNPDRIGRVAYVSVFNDHLIDETLSQETTPNWQSDHGQVVASIEIEREYRSRQTQVSIHSRTEMTQEKFAKAEIVQIKKTSL
jgi:endonuclease/exonuclease/phosphatase family metal-dependent hydrolase